MPKLTAILVCSLLALTAAFPFPLPLPLPRPHPHLPPPHKCSDTGKKLVKGYIQIVREATNSSLVVAETPAFGAAQSPPFSTGYLAVFTYRITSSFAYSSPRIGLLRGAFVVIEPNLVYVAGALELDNEAGYVNLLGKLSYNSTVNKAPLVGGTDDNFYAIGNATITGVARYGTNNVNTVAYLDAVYYLLC